MGSRARVGSRGVRDALGAFVQSTHVSVYPLYGVLVAAPGTGTKDSDPTRHDLLREIERSIDFGALTASGWERDEVGPFHIEWKKALPELIVAIQLPAFLLIGPPQTHRSMRLHVSRFKANSRSSSRGASEQGKGRCGRPCGASPPSCRCDRRFSSKAPKSRTVQGMSEHLSLEEGYKAMLLYLDAHWRRNGKPDEIGGLLGGMALAEDGEPMDPAAWADWEEAVAEMRRSSSERFASGL